MQYHEIMQLPYAIFLGYLKYAKVFEMEKTKEGREQLELSKVIEKTEPEINKLRTLKI